MLQVFFAVALIWDIVAVKFDRTGTLSKVTLIGCFNHPSLPFALGTLIGHMLWPMIIVNELGYWKISLPLLGVFLAGCVIFDFGFGVSKVLPPIIYFLCGLIFGHFGWPQSEKNIF